MTPDFLCRRYRRTRQGESQRMAYRRRQTLHDCRRQFPVRQHTGQWRRHLQKNFLWKIRCRLDQICRRQGILTCRNRNTSPAHLAGLCLSGKHSMQFRIAVFDNNDGGNMLRMLFLSAALLFTAFSPSAWSGDIGIILLHGKASMPSGLGMQNLASALEAKGIWSASPKWAGRAIAYMTPAMTSR